MYSLACVDPKILYLENLGLSAAGVMKAFERSEAGRCCKGGLVKCIEEMGEGEVWCMEEVGGM